MNESRNPAVLLRRVSLAAFLAVFGGGTVLSAAKVEGKVVDKAGKAVPSARLEMHVGNVDGQVAASATADKKGRFEIEAPAGTYVLTIEAPGFGRAEYDAPLAEGQSVEVELVVQDRETWLQTQVPKLFRAGVEALQSGDMATAKKKFAEVESLSPSFPPIFRVKAAMAHQEKDWGAAAAAVDRVVELEGGLDPQLAPLAFEAYFQAGSTAKADAALALVADASERAALAIPVYNLAVRKSREEKFDEALALFAKAAELDPSGVPYHQGLAAIEFNRENYAAARPHLDRLLALDSAHGEGLRMSYFTALQLGEPSLQEAATAYLASGGDEVAERVLADGEARFETNDRSRARAIADALLSERPQLARAHYLLGRILASGGDPSGAKVHLKHFVEMAPGDPDAAAAAAMIAQL